MGLGSEKDNRGETTAVTAFLSYSRDDREQALPIIAGLEAAGIEVWWDGLLAGGDTFAHTTEAALETAEAVVVLWSARSIQSHWVRDEATRGRDRGRMVPVSLDGTMPPLGFRQVQYIDLSNWRCDTGSASFTELVRAIAKVGRSPAGRLSFGLASPVPPAPHRRRFLALAGGVLALAGGSLAAWKAGLFSGNPSGDMLG